MAAAILAMLMGRPALATQREGRDAALDAYETAVERLRARDHAVTQAHQEELRHLRETIKDKEAMARAGELTSGIVHEVRNGLGTLAGYVRLLEQTPGASAETGEIVRSIREECQALESVIRRIVEFVRTEKLRPSGIDLRRFLERVVARERHSRAGAEVRVEVPEDLCVVGDEDLLERAFENLVRNARDAAGGQGHVAVEARAEEDGVCVRIEDDGPGLPPQLQGGLRPFGTTKPGGLGLGLPTALKIITLHGGGLDLLPRKPRGLTAQVRLPYSGPAGDATSGDTAGQAPDRREGGAD
jgi:signal transduction histidine kinase